MNPWWVLTMDGKRRAARLLVLRLSTAVAVDDDGGSSASVVAEIRRLSKHDPESRTHLVDAGAVPLLSGCLLLSASAGEEEDSAAALLNLSISDPESLMSCPAVLDALASTIHRGVSSAAAEAAQHAAAAVYSLLTVDAYRPIIGSKRGLISALVALVRRPGAAIRSIKDGLKALFAAALYPLNRPAMVDLGVVGAVFSLMVKDGRRGVVEDASAVAAQVAGCAEAVEAFRRVAGVRVLVDLADPAAGASMRSRENAVAAMLNLALSGGESAVGDIWEVENAEEAVVDMGERGSERGKKKARALLALLRSGSRVRRCWSEFEIPAPPPPSICSSGGDDYTF